MRIAIIGGGFTGLTAAYELARAGHRVTVFEKDKVLGGLAHGFKKPGWSWHLEYAYHHLFANDWAILSLIKELDLEDKLILTRPVTANYHRGKIYQFDSPLHLFRYPELRLTAKLRTGVLLSFLKLNPFWQLLESITARSLIQRIGGDEAWKKLWQPLLAAKFANYAPTVAASWFWARIKKRTPKLYYIRGGFHTLVTALEEGILHHGGTVKKNCKFDCGRNDKYNSFSCGSFDRFLFTTPTAVAAKLLSNFSRITSHVSLPLSIPHLHAQTLILETKEPILKKVYWLNITDRTFPFLAVVAHTNMVDKRHYGGHHITYFGNYLPSGHPYLSMNKDQLLKVFLPFIKRLNPSFHSSFIIHHSSFLGFYAQPVHQLHYSKIAPRLETPIKGIYLANLDNIYPWDRGTNYAVELGQRAAHALSSRA